MLSDFEAVIGLEVHCQLSTQSKIFCSCPARLQEGKSVADVAPNLNTCPVCTGQPGALPVLNKKAVEYAVRAGLATHCDIQLESVFSRKNYFYPDLPKGYQISQYDLPVCGKGWLEIPRDPTPKRIGITRIHLEEDAGKNVHEVGYSAVNLNRAGVPLIEIVSEPEMCSADEAGAYLRTLHSLVVTLGICDGNMQEGNFRCDANVSVRKRGAQILGTRAEIKNVNSFRFIEKAIEYEIQRQVQVIVSGGKIVQETRGYDSDKNVTVSQRSKEEAHDYRYFPDPDLLPLRLSPEWVEALRRELPELPDQKRARYSEQYKLSPQDAATLSVSKVLSEFFGKTIALFPEGDLTVPAKAIVNFLTGEVTRLSSEASVDLAQSKVSPRHLADLVQASVGGVLSSSGAKQVLISVWSSGLSVEATIEKEGLKQVSDTGALEPIVKKIIESNPAQAAELKAGKDKLMSFFVGKAMKASGGKANPAMVQQIVKKLLGLERS
ncbi:Asp-tRNA(Asn)/Glu-tRNA(Gln) amidotransferase subunit GatB [Bdellovibrionota bacterium FG-2]